jgi:hypothetical protein
MAITRDQHGRAESADPSADDQDVHASIIAIEPLITRALAHQFSVVGIRLAGPSRRRQLMEDKRDPDMDNDEIGNSNEEDIVDSTDDEFEDADEEDDDESDELDTNLES